MEEIQNLSKYFSSLIDTIPLSVYFNRDEEIIEDIKLKKSSTFKENDLSLKSKNKRMKLDSSVNLKVSDIASAYFNKQKNDKKLKELKKKLHRKIKELKDSRGGTSERKQETLRTTAKDGHSNIQQDGDSEKKAPKIFNEEGDLVFSKFDLTSHNDSINSKMNSPVKKKKNLKVLFEKAKKDEKRISKLEKIDVDAAHKLKEKKIWQNVLNKSEGNKVHDNPKLLEKKIKRKMKSKVKSSKVWKERKTKVEVSKNKKQEKRERNLNKRKEMKKSKKIKLLKKKGRILQ